MMVEVIWDPTHLLTQTHTKSYAVWWVLTPYTSCVIPDTLYLLPYTLYMLPFTLYLLPYLNTRSHTQFSFRYNTACSRGEESTLEAAKANLEAQKKITAELQLEVAEALKRQAACQKDRVVIC